MKTRNRILLAGALFALAVAVACAKADVLSPSTAVGTVSLGAPAIETPGDDELLPTVRPTLTVRNAPSNTAGTRTYEFQVSDNTAFSTIAAQKTGIAESILGSTSFTVESDLQTTTRYYWRARVTQGSTTSAWSSTGRFRTSISGYNRPGELYDPLVGGNSVGTAVGSTSFVGGQGLRINDQNSYVRYQLPQTMTAGEFSMDVVGLYPNGPGQKLKVFSMFDGTGNLTGSRYEVHAQYRGISGNPENAIAFKAVFGGATIETDLGQRALGVRTLDPGQVYYWQASWNSSAFRLVVRDGGITGGVIYDRTIAVPGGATYAPSTHYAYLGATSGSYGLDTGSWPGVTYRNVWLSDKPRPTALGSALSPPR